MPMDCVVSNHKSTQNTKLDKVKSRQNRKQYIIGICLKKTYGSGCSLFRKNVIYSDNSDTILNFLIRKSSKKLKYDI